MGVRVITMEDLRFEPFDDAFRVALRRARRGTAGFGVTVDLDVFDPVVAPGIGTPVSGGLRAEPVLEALAGLRPLPDFLGIEVAEFNPNNDVDRRTERLALDLISSALVARGKR
jgi:arginase family enzyme